MEVRGPNGELRWLRHPWSVLAFQIAGADGLRLLHPDGEDAERASPPAEPLIEELLQRPQAEDRATLVLIDEVLMYARDKVDRFPNWRGLLTDFFCASVRCGRQGRPLRDGGLAARLRPDEKRRFWQGADRAGVRDLQQVQGADGPTGVEG
jgi:hypothetical protein